MARGVAAAQRQQLGAQVDDELHALRHADEFAQQPYRGRFQRRGAAPARGSLPARHLLDGLHRGLARQAIVTGKRQQELLAAGRRQREVGLSQLRRAAAPRRLAALAFEAGVDAALQSRDVVVGQIGAQRRADGLAGAARGVDESIAKTFKGSVDGIGEQQGHIPIMSQQTCHSSGGT